MATSIYGDVFSIEAKSTVGKLAYVPADQIERCITALKLFEYYPNKHIVFAFKFGQKKGYKLQEYFFDGESLQYELLEKIRLINFIRCRRNGECVISYKDAIIDLGTPTELISLMLGKVQSKL